VRDKEVKSTPLRGEDPESVESRKGKGRAVESYPNDDTNLDASALEIEGEEASEVCLPFFYPVNTHNGIH
jgi:hypothetical protein